MPIDNTRIQKYYVFVHVGSSFITESDLTTFYCAFGGSTQPATDSMLWKNTPQKNGGYDPELDRFHVDYNIYDGDATGGIQYYSHDPGAATLIHNQSWIWVKFQRNSKTYVGGAEIGDYEIRVFPAEDNTQYIGTHIYIENQDDPGGDPDPDPPTPTGRKYRIYVKREDKHTLIDNENILVGNTRGDGKSKETSGMTMGAEYSYVEFNSWQELTEAAGGGSGPTPAETLRISLSKDDIDASGETIYLTVTSNTNWTLSESDPWIIPSRREGSYNEIIPIMVIANSGSNIRSGAITATTSGGLTKNVPLQQRKRSEITYRLELGMSTMSVGVGETVRITATYITYEAGQEISRQDVTSNTGVAWRSGDTSIVIAGAGGDVTGVSPGSTEIWAIYNGTQSDDTSVNVY